MQSPRSNETNVLVLGAGVAGHCAAIAAAGAGVSVLLREKAEECEGSSPRAVGGFPFAATDLQKDAGFFDDLNVFGQDLFATQVHWPPNAGADDGGCRCFGERIDGLLAAGELVAVSTALPA